MIVNLLRNSRFHDVWDIALSLRLSLFLLLCWFLGGTSQDIIGPKLPLYLISLAIIGISLSLITKESRVWKLKPFLFIWVLFFCIHLFYLIPLPSGLWSALPGRAHIAHGFELLEAPLPWLPLSITPEKTFFSLFDFLPPLAVILAMGTFVRVSEIWICLWVLCGFVLISVTVGLLQITGNFSNLYFYDFTNEDVAVGFFSNANHYGAQLLISIPIIFFLIERYRANGYQRHNAKISFCIIVLLLALLGIGLSGSLGGYLLIIPVLASVFLVSGSRDKLKNLYFIGIFAPFIAALLFDMFVWNDLQTELVDEITNKSSRQVMFANTYQIGKVFFPFGGGPGSFSEAYRLVEQGGRLTIPHAHNDYIETFLEFGIIGIIGIFLFLVWLVKLISNGYSRNNSVAKYMSISIAIVVIHSLFDYSLRTINIMTLISFCICTILLTNESVSLNNQT